MMRRRRYGLTWNERAHDLWDRFLLCEVKKKHQAKMDSHGLCVRCGRRVT